jgi:hypothetical protein
VNKPVTTCVHASADLPTGRTVVLNLQKLATGRRIQAEFSSTSFGFDLEAGSPEIAGLTGLAGVW